TGFGERQMTGNPNSVRPAEASCPPSPQPETRGLSGLNWASPEAEPMVRRALGELQLATIPRGEGDGDKTARLELYLRELRRFPPERVIRALRAWPKQGEKPDGRRPGRYFPSLDELIEFLTVPTRTAEHRVFGEREALPNYSTRRDPRVAEGL